jgi:hypothetical protein
MQNVPQIVRERLKAAPPAVDHPDADVLTAFAERALPDRERAVVLEHLARCGDCRNIVALALPDVEANQAVTVTGRGWWLKWSGLRWAFATVGIVVIASFGVLQYQRSRQKQSTQTMAAVMKQSRLESVAGQVQQSPSAHANEPAREPEKALREAPPATDAISAAAPATLPEPKLLSRVVPPAAHRPQSPGAVGGVVGGGSAYGFGPHMPQAQQQITTSQQQAFTHSARQKGADGSANLRVPVTSQTAEAQAATNQVATSQAETQAQDQLAALPSRPAEQLFDEDASARVRKAKPAAATPPQPSPTLPNATLIPRWAINPAGGLQRSFDQGNTWQDVDVSANAVPPAGSTFVALAKESRAKEALEKDADKKILKASASAPVFRAVVVNGPDVWAGGSQGLLYHSYDAGNHWMQIVPASAGATLTGDIVGLGFSDAQHGRITTSTGEIWTTGDQGQTWQRQ